MLCAVKGNAPVQYLHLRCRIAVGAPLLAEANHCRAADKVNIHTHEARPVVWQRRGGRTVGLQLIQHNYCPTSTKLRSDAVCVSSCYLLNKLYSISLCCSLAEQYFELSKIISSYFCMCLYANAMAGTSALRTNIDESPVVLDPLHRPALGVFLLFLLGNLWCLTTHLTSTRQRSVHLTCIGGHKH